MKVAALSILIVMAVSILAPSIGVFAGPGTAEASIGQLDVCHSGTAAVGSEATYLCQCPCCFTPAVRHERTAVQLFHPTQYLLVFRDERPPQV